MTYETFKEDILKTVQDECTPGTKINIHQVVKNNDTILDGLVIMGANESIAPTFYLNGYYDALKSGSCSFDEIVEHILDLKSETVPYEDFRAESFIDFSAIKDRIVFRLVKKEGNEKFLSDLPFVPYLDLAVVFSVLLSRTKEGLGSILIHTSHMKQWNTTPSELFDLALSNSPGLLTPSLHTMEEMINHPELLSGEDAADCPTPISGVEVSDQPEMLSGEETTDQFGLLSDETFPDISYPSIHWSEDYADSPMLVLTNNSRLHGATTLLYPHLLSEISERLNQDLYLLPSSIHEVLLVPADLIGDRQELDLMVQEVNKDHVARDEVLSDHAYFYSRKRNSLEC